MSDLDVIHKEALSRFDRLTSLDREQRDYAIEDLKFANDEDGQWDDDAIAKRANRPRYTINRIDGAISQLVGDQRQNRIMIKVSPSVDGEKEVADIYNGLIRSIETRSNAADAYDNAFKEAVTCGYGGWRVVTKYDDCMSFDQDIYIERIDSAASSLFVAKDRSYAFVTMSMPIDEFKRKYKDVDTDGIKPGIRGGIDWHSGQNVILTEYWRKVPYEKNIALLSDGRVIDLDEDGAAIDDLGLQIIKQRKAKSHYVEMYIMTGSKILEGAHRWAGSEIPLIECRGKEICIEGKKYTRGIVRFAKDANRIYNYAISANIEAAALTPKDPIWLTPEQARGHEQQLKTFNKRNHPFMFYNPDPEAPGAPKRGGAPQVQQALLSQVQQAALDIETTTGIYAASLGNAPQLLSERSVQSQAEKGDRGAYEFSDNLQKAIKKTGEILVDLIPKIYDRQRVVRITGIDGTQEPVEINAILTDVLGQPVIDEQTGKEIIVNDLSRGKYEVTVETGAAYSTLRKESAAQLIELASSSDEFRQVALDLIAKNLDVLESDELTKRIRAVMIKQGVIQPTDDEIKELGLDQQQPDQSQQALTDNVMMQTAKLQADIQKRDAEILNLQIKNNQLLVDTAIKKLKEGLPLTDQERNLIIKQRDIIDAEQQAEHEGLNSAQAEDIANLLKNLQVQ